jgi:hypothetical protein
MLGTETVQLEESNEEINRQIESMIARGKLSEQERINLERSLKDECEMLTSEIQKK